MLKIRAGAVSNNNLRLCVYVLIISALFVF